MKKFLLAAAIVGILALNACSSQPQETTIVTTMTTIQPQPAVVIGLEVVSMPRKTNYLIGEDFDPSGLVINATRSDGTVIENVEWTMDENLFLTSNTTGVKISYGGKTVQIPVLVRHPGNVDEFSVENFATLDNSPLQGKTFFWLGSSVTLGSSAMEESMADFLAKKHDCVCIKEAVSGTTLATYKKNSYVERLEAYLISEDRAEHVDAVIIQLSTNDQNKPESFGTVTASDVRDPADFDTETTFGAMEYIIARVKQTWDCPVLFYANPPTENSNYMTMVLGLYDIAAKWDIHVIDMFMDLEFQSIPTAEQKKLWMSDKIHPTKAGYRDWWLPKFEEALIALK